MLKRFHVAGPPEDRPLEPIEFEVAGVDEDGKEWVEKFRCLDYAPAGCLADLVLAATVNDAGAIVFNKTSVLRFLRGLLKSESMLPFDVMTHRKDRVVRIEDLGPIAVWLSEQYTDRPTGPRRLSGDGSSRNGGGSPQEPHSAESTPTSSDAETSESSSTPASS